MTEPRWDAVTASARGSSHTADSPNQDAVRQVRLSPLDGPPMVIAAVADGHGGTRYVRSDVGARIAVDVAIEHLSSAVRAMTPTDAADLERTLRRQVPEVVAQWYAAVEQHRRAHPFLVAETARAGGADLNQSPEIAYGSTLLIAIVSPAGVGLAQIGDGDAVVRIRGGLALRPVPGDVRLAAGATTSLGLPTAVDDFRFAAVPAAEDPDVVLLATDGYGNSFADDEWWPPVMADLAAAVAAADLDTLSNRLPGWLAESARVGGDDVSAAVVVRYPLVGPAPAVPVPSTASAATVRLPVLPPPGSPPANPAGVGSSGNRRKYRVIAAIVAVVALAILAAGWFLLTRSDDQPTAPGPGSSVPPGVSSSIPNPSPSISGSASASPSGPSVSLSASDHSSVPGGGTDASKAPGGSVRPPGVGTDRGTRPVPQN